MEVPVVLEELEELEVLVVLDFVVEEEVGH